MNFEEIEGRAFSGEQRFRLYLEGVNCPFTRIEYVCEDGMIPQLHFSLPATEYVIDLRRRIKVHLLHHEMVHDRWVVLYEGEMITRGFRKTPQSREISFVSEHVTGLLDQLQISALDPISAIAQQARGEDIAEPFLVKPIGMADAFHVFTNEFVASQLSTPGNILTHAHINFPLWVKGVFTIYRNLLNASRVKRSYYNYAVAMHRLHERVITPDVIANWDSFYNKLLGIILQSQIRPRANRISFFGMLAAMAAEILHQVTIVPNADSYKRQIQIKPATLFNAIPKCNVIYPIQADSWTYVENRSNMITRLIGLLAPVGSMINPHAMGMARFFTVFAPSELQWRWDHITNKLGDKDLNATTGGIIQLQAGKLNFIAPKDKENQTISFLTSDEQSFGIIPEYLDVPETLAFIVREIVGLADESKSVAPLPPDPPPTPAVSSAASASLRSGDKAARITKYRAFVSQALGAKDGIDTDPPGPDKPWAPLGKDNPFKYPKRKTLIPWAKGTDKVNTLPTRVTFLGLDIKVPPKYGLARSSSGVSMRTIVDPPFRSALNATGCNYLITTEGVIIETLQRRHMAFEEPVTLPLGISIKGVSPADVLAFNSKIPPRGKSRATASTHGGSITINTVAGAPTWPVAPSWTTGTPVALLGEEIGKVRALPVQSSPTPVWEHRPGTGGSGEPTTSDWWVFKTSTPFPGWDDLLVGDKAKITTGASPVITNILALQLASNNDGTELYYGIKFGRSRGVSVIDINSAQKIEVTSSKLVAASNTWVLIPESKHGKSGIAPRALDPSEVEKVANGISPGSPSSPSAVCGNHANVAIALECPGGVFKSSPKQLAAAAYVLACIRELRTDTPFGPSGEYKDDRDSRATRVEGRNIWALEDYFPTNPPNNIKIPGARDQILAQAENIQDGIYKGFKLWDTALMAGKPFDLGIDTPADMPAVDEALPPPLVPTAGGRLAAAAKAVADARKLAAKVKGKRLLEDLKPGDPRIKLMGDYVTSYMNFQFYNRRHARQTFENGMVFNPYLLVGYPCAILDGGRAWHHLVGYIHGVRHVIEPDSARTYPTFTHLRVVREGQNEAIIPFKDKNPLAGQILYQMTDTNGDIMAGYGEVLVPDTHLPHQMLSIYGAPPPFLYDGGFGLGKRTVGDERRAGASVGRERDFTALARFCGLGMNNTIRSDASVLNTSQSEENFIFADSPQLVGPVKPLTLKEVHETIYRDIQRVGSDTPTEASLVSFHHPDKLTEKQAVSNEIKVADIAFDKTTQKAIRDHANLISKMEARID